MSGTFDYVVVGGGTAGSVVARRLAEDPGCAVALLEAGPPDEGDDRVLEVARWPDLLGTELDYDYAIEPQPRGNGRIRHSRARVLGGCSSHNSCIAFRAPDADLRDWEARGAAGWGPAAVAAAYGRVLDRVRTEVVPDGHPLNDAFLAAAAADGLPRVELGLAAELAEGAGPFRLNTQGPLRQSASVAYLHPLAGLPANLTLATGVGARRVALDGGRAVGVETDAGAYAARREVIVCCGAFDTPKLLLLSGIGPRWHLREVGLELRRDLPGVGEGLLDHPEGVVVYESARPVPPPLRQAWEAGVFCRVLPGAERPDLMMHFGLVPFDWNTAPLGYPTAEHGFSLTPNVCRARSRGTVRLRSADPAEPPRIDFRYFTDPEGYDEEVMLAGLKRARRIAARGPLAAWAARELAPGADVTGDRELSEYVRRTANTVYHPAGTCRIGAAGDPLAVVDPALRVQGVEGLRVADASVFPSMISVNPAITVMMIGERCAELVRGAAPG